MAAAMAQARPIESLIESYVDSQRPAAEQVPKIPLIQLF